MRTLRAQALRIPFRRSFKHATAERHTTQTLWVEAGSAHGPHGFGEGCPREYVSGETIDTALRFFDEVRDEAAAIEGIDALRTWVTVNRSRLDAHPAAWCAIELALLDVIAKEQAVSVERLLGLPPITGPFSYTAVLGVSDVATFRRQLDQYLQLGFRDFKVKLAGDAAADHERLACVDAQREFVRSLRLDANNLWTDAGAALAYLQGLRAPFFAIEEPLSPGDYDGLRQLASGLGRQIILDESLLRVDQLAELHPCPGPWILNVRVSKMGGLLRSLALVNRARALNLPLIIGCQVGETSVLTRAALTVAQLVRTTGLLAQEGAFGTQLLAHDMVTPTLVFGAAGRLEVDSGGFGEAPGFGLEVRASTTEHL